MNNETCTIYFALHPLTEKTILLKDREQYLSCKFWLATKREADIFYAYYPGSVYAELHRIVGILSGWLLKKDDLMHAYSQLTKVIDAYRFWRADKVNRLFKRLPLFKKILDGMTQDKSYPVENLLDDVLDWCQNKQIIDELSTNQIRQKIDDTRCHPYLNNNHISTEDLFEIIKLLIEHNCSLLYNDAKILLFPKKELLPQLSAAVMRGEILARYSVSKNIYYFDTCSLIKWLIREKLLSVEMVNQFSSLAVEAIKEGVVDYEGPFNSLKKLIELGTDRNDLLLQARKREIILSLKYPRKYLNWRENWGKLLVVTCKEYFASQRYDGLGELKVAKAEDSFRGQFGGLTVDMLIYGETPEYCTSKPVYEIELVPTRAEYDVGLQAFITIPPEEIKKILADENLIVTMPDKNQCLVQREETEEGKKDQELKKLWQDVLEKLHKISASMQKGNKMQLVDDAISLILDTVKKINSDFDPMIMPGTVEDFYKFCLSLPHGNKIFPSSKMSFGKYCKRTIKKVKNKQPPLCAWINNPTPNNEFWEKLKPNHKSYVVKQMTFT